MASRLFLRSSFVLLLFVVAGPLTSQSGFQVVVNTANPQSAMAKEDVSKLFLRKTISWSSGLKVAPVDQAASRSVRDLFTQKVHGKPVAAINAYWQKLIYSGRKTPPPQLASDSEVLNYLRRNSGGIGYVSAGATIGNGLKRLIVN